MPSRVARNTVARSRSNGNPAAYDAGTNSLPRALRRSSRLLRFLEEMRDGRGGATQPVEIGPTSADGASAANRCSARTAGALDHYMFPWHGREKKIDPTRAMTSWPTAWRSLRAASGLENVRFHDGRHTALTRLAEAGQADWVIQAQMGHVSPAMMKTYSHIRRQALDEAAAAPEPAFDFRQSEFDSVEHIESADAERATSQGHVTIRRVGTRAD